MKTAWIVALLLFATIASAINDEQFDAIKQLGSLNGVALNCGYLNETHRMKRSLVSTVPKIRPIGIAFEQSTNEAFLAMITAREACPSEKTIGKQVDERIELLERAFINHQEKLF